MSNAPHRSPSHQVRHTRASDAAGTAFPATAASDPIVALTSVPISAASSSPPSPGIDPSSACRRANRRISSAATSTSSRFPKLWATAEPTGSAE